ncbi:hypothetical protein ACUY2G_13930, partial [Corynebacterium guaraldiae]
ASPKLGIPNPGRSGNRILGPAPAASNNRNQGKCLGTKPGALHRPVEETLLNSAVVRMDPAVHTQKLRPLTDINEKDLATVELGMTVESRVMRGHSKAGEIAAQDFPKSSVLKVELERLTEFHKSVRKRRQ